MSDCKHEFYAPTGNCLKCTLHYSDIIDTLKFRVAKLEEAKPRSMVAELVTVVKYISSCNECAACFEMSQAVITKAEEGGM